MHACFAPTFIPLGERIPSPLQLQTVQTIIIHDKLILVEFEFCCFESVCHRHATCDANPRGNVVRLAPGAGRKHDQFVSKGRTQFARGHLHLLFGAAEADSGSRDQQPQRCSARAPSCGGWRQAERHRSGRPSPRMHAAPAGTPTSWHQLERAQRVYAFANSPAGRYSARLRGQMRRALSARCKRPDKEEPRPRTRPSSGACCACCGSMRRCIGSS